MTLKEYSFSDLINLRAEIFKKLNSLEFYKNSSYSEKLHKLENKILLEINKRIDNLIK